MNLKVTINKVKRLGDIVVWQEKIRGIIAV